jgi:ABC-type uncharacterized transport system substrate-binding protein
MMRSSRLLSVGLPQFIRQGALISYGSGAAEIARASHVDRRLKGRFGVQAPTTFELAINRKTARSIGITIPPTLLARADEVIE